MSELYSPMIADCIAEMLVYDVEERISVQDLALLVYLNSPNEKIEGNKEQQQPMKTTARGSSTLPPLPKPSPPSTQQKQQQQMQQNVNSMQHPHLQGPPPQQINGQIPNNNIIMPSPNYTYSHIRPNNQSLLSTSTLQNKLKVIEQIN